MSRLIPRSRGALVVLLALLLPLGGMALGLATRDIVPKPPPRPGRLPESHWARGPILEMARDDFGIAVVDGRIYVLGGMTGARGNKLDSVEVYEPGAGAWVAGPVMPEARSSLSAAAVGPVIYALGGALGDESTTGRVDALDTRTGSWAARAPLPTPRFGLAAVELGGRIYAIGG